MSLNNVRLLSLTDKEKFLDMIGSRLSEGEVENKFGTFLDHLDLYLSDSQNKSDFLWGAFDSQERLISTMGIHYWPSLPYATLSYMFIRKTNERFSAENNGLVYCLHKCLEQGEQNNIRAFYSLQKSRTILHKREVWRKHDTDITKKYYSTVEVVVPKNEKSHLGIVWELMDKQVWPFETVLWNTRLKPEFEKVINW